MLGVQIVLKFEFSQSTKGCKQALAVEFLGNLFTSCRSWI